MIDDNFFDYDEYEFFNELSDNEKLFYIYDVFINELSDELLDTIEFKEYNSITPPSNNDMYELGQPIEAFIRSDIDNKLHISSESIDVINIISNNLIIDGYILLNKSVKVDRGLITVSYNMLEGLPISLN
jgi:hypothetical protein